MDWIERATEAAPTRDGMRNAQSGGHSYSTWADIVSNITHDGIEEVRALRDERDRLKELLEITRNGENTAYNKIERLEREKADLERVHGKLQHVFFKEVEIIERLYELLNKADSEIARLKRGDALLTKEKARNSCKMNDSLRYQLGDEVLKLFCEHGDYLKDD